MVSCPDKNSTIKLYLKGICTHKVQYVPKNYNQIFALISLIIATRFFYYRVNKSKFSFLYALVIFSFFTNPYFLNVLAFKTASGYMVLSAGLVLIAASLNTRSRAFNILAATALIVCSCGFYQSCINVFCGAMVIIFLSDYYKNSKLAFHYLLENLAKLVVALLSYKFFILNRIDTGAYFKLNTQAFSIDFNLLGNMSHRFLELAKRYLFIFNESNMLIVFSFIAIAVYGFVLIKKKTNKLLALLIYLCSVALIVLNHFLLLVFDNGEKSYL